MKRELHGIGSSYTLPVLDTLFTMPIFSTPEFERYSEIPRVSANRLLNVLKKKKIITILKEGQGRRPNTFIFNDLIAITETPLEMKL